MSTGTPYNDEWITVPNNFKLYARLQAPTEVKGAVVFVHGFIEHLGRYDFVRERLVEKGFAVLFFDQRGFGKSALDVKNRTTGAAYGKNTREELIGDVEFMLNFARERFKTDNLFIYGHSMGGCVSLQYACIGKDNLNVRQYLRGVVSTSPLIRLTHPEAQWKLTAGHFLSKVMPWMSIPAPVNAKQLTHDEVIQREYLDDPLVIEQGTLRGIDTMLRGGASFVGRDFRQWPEALPVMLFHGSEDQVTDPKATQQFFDEVKATDKHIEIIQGSYHEIHNEPEFKVKLLDDITSWLLAHLPKKDAATTSASAPVAEPATAEPAPPVAPATEAAENANAKL